jgi:hypothetical protein
MEDLSCCIAIYCGRFFPKLVEPEPPADIMRWQQVRVELG